MAFSLATSSSALAPVRGRRLQLGALATRASLTSVAHVRCPLAQAARASVAMQMPFDVRSMPGVTAPLGFFDPMGFSEGASEGKIKFYRECEIKHGRVAMLASLGFVVGEAFHPMWGGDIDVPSVIAFQETPLNDLLGPLGFIDNVLYLYPLRLVQFSRYGCRRAPEPLGALSRDLHLAPFHDGSHLTALGGKGRGCHPLGSEPAVRHSRGRGGRHRVPRSVQREKTAR